ncbi:MAG: hypothetical protein HY868_08140 [Chloroflexi bacterium]|nr:hypothetical protein [Chloroflexota bacterium]
MNAKSLTLRVSQILGLALVIAFIGLAGWWLPVPIVRAATLTVTNVNDSGAGSLRQAITNAAAGDTIMFDASLRGGTITLTGGQLAINQSLTIQGLGATDLTIRGNNASRVFNIGANVVVTIADLTVADGYANNARGGGIINAGSLTLNNCIITRNQIGGALLGILTYGGSGIYNSGALTITNSTISDNRDANNSAGGGGIYNDGTFYLSNSIVRNNQSRTISRYGIVGGGGICNRGTATITSSTIISNTATGYTFGGGGGIYNDGTLTIISSVVRENNATQTFGGGIMNAAQGALTIRTSTLANNTTNQDGGGIENVGTLTISQSTISGNVANSIYFGGGGIDNTEGAVILENSTVSNNRASPSGGGIRNEEGQVTITFSTLSGNTGNPIGGGIYITGNVTNTMTSLATSIIANNTGQDCVNLGGGITIASTLVEDNTCAPTFSGDPGLGPLQNNGGTTETHALSPGSLAIDRILQSENGCGASIVSDQRGTSRPNNVRCDLGAYEYVRPTAVTLSAFGARGDELPWSLEHALGTLVCGVALVLGGWLYRRVGFTRK